MRKIYCSVTDEEITGPFIQTNVDSGAVTIQDPYNNRHKFLNEHSQMRVKDLPTYIDYLYEQYDRAPWIPNKSQEQSVDDGVIITLAS